MTARAHLVITGHVQGVYFRANTQKQAMLLGLKGWVKNLPAGQVEAIFEGNKEKIEKIISWCKKGPSFSNVDHVKITWEKPLKEFDTFTVKY